MTDARVGRVAERALVSPSPADRVARVTERVLLQPSPDARTARVTERALLRPTPDIRSARVAARVLTLLPAVSDQTIVVGQAESTSTALPATATIGAQVIVTGQATSVSTALPATAIGSQSVTVGQATSASTALTATPVLSVFPQTVVVGQAVSTSTALAAVKTLGKVTRAVGQAETTSSALEARFGTRVVVGQATSTSVALAATKVTPLVRGVGQAESSSSVPVDPAGPPPASHPGVLQGYYDSPPNFSDMEMVPPGSACGPQTYVCNYDGAYDLPVLRWRLPIATTTSWIRVDLLLSTYIDGTIDNYLGGYATVTPVNPGDPPPNLYGTNTPFSYNLTDHVIEAVAGTEYYVTVYFFRDTDTPPYYLYGAEFISILRVSNFTTPGVEPPLLPYVAPEPPTADLPTSATPVLGPVTIQTGQAQTSSQTLPVDLAGHTVVGMAETTSRALPALVRTTDPLNQTVRVGQAETTSKALHPTSAAAVTVQVGQAESTSIALPVAVASRLRGEYWDGTQTQQAALVGYWDGTTVAEAHVEGYWDGTTVRPLTQT